MRQYMIDEITFLERDALDSYLKRTLKQGGLEGVFFLSVPPDLLGPEQQGHEQCGPFYFTVILEQSSLRFELLIRSASNMHCSCIALATVAQRLFVLDFADRMLKEEMIRA
jgi:protein involved in sex pheromone biosynthesis